MSNANNAIMILRIRQVCERTSLSRSTLYLAMRAGTFPKPVALGARAVAGAERRGATVRDVRPLQKPSRRSGVRRPRRVGALRLVRLALDGLCHDLENEFGDYGDPVMSFLAAWRASTHCWALNRAVRAAMAEPQPTEHSISKKFTLFINICKHLQLEMGEEPIILSVAVFAEKLNVSPRSITDYRRQGEREGLLEEVAKSDFPSRRAARFRYLGP